MLLHVLFCIVLGGCASSSTLETQLRDGDIIFQTSQSSQSRAIHNATHSDYTHMGMVVLRNGRAFVFEASATVRYTSFATWVARGEGGHFVVKRLRKAVGSVTPTAMERARVVMQRFSGVAYDTTFEWSDSLMYCSELVWKIYDRALHIQVGELQRLGSFDLSDSTVRALMARRYGSNVPLDEPVISPAAMFDSPLLEVVVTR